MIPIHRPLSLLVSTVLAVCLYGQQPAPVPAPAGAPAAPAAGAQDPAAQGRDTAAAIQKQFADERIEIDLKAGTVTVPAIAIEPPDLIEYLLIHRKGKKHEALFYTESKPSVLNAALLLLGLAPGKNASYREKEPPPTLDEIEKGADPIVVTPPSGTEFWMTVRWTDAGGQDREHCAEDLIADMTTRAPLRDASWIFLGGRMASLNRNEPEVYVADFEGNLVSICYLTPDNHLGTMRHARARDDDNWWLTDHMPKAGTAVRFTFHKAKSALHVAREERLRQADAEAAKPDGGKEAGKDGEKKDAGK